MNLAQLSYFRHLADIQHYTRAAEDLHISQSALSHSIASLESELGCSLFRREGRNVRLTEDGRVFQGYIRDGLALIEQGTAELKRRNGMLSGAVEVGAIATVRSGYLPAAMKAYRDHYGPLVEFHVAQGETLPLNQRLEQGVYDLVIAGPYERPGVERITLFHQQLVVALHRDHPLAALSRIKWENLIGHTVITYRRGIPCGEALQRLLETTNAPMEKMTLVRNYEDEVILGALAVHESSVALTMLTSNLLPNPDMVLLPLDVEGAREFYPISLTYQSKAAHSPAAQSFIDFLKTFPAPAYDRPDFKSEA